MGKTTEVERLKRLLKTCTDENIIYSVKKRIEILEKRETVYKDEKDRN